MSGEMPDLCAKLQPEPNAGVVRYSPKPSPDYWTAGKPPEMVAFLLLSWYNYFMKTNFLKEFILVGDSRTSVWACRMNLVMIFLCTILISFMFWIGFAVIGVLSVGSFFALIKIPLKDNAAFMIMGSCGMMGVYFISRPFIKAFKETLEALRSLKRAKNQTFQEETGHIFPPNCG